MIVEGHYTTEPVHQAYIEPHACLCSYGADGQCTVYSSSQGHFMVRSYVAKLLGIEISNIRCTPAEIGGGFGGKTLVYLEPVALALSRKCGRPVKMQMTREEVFRASGPTSGAVMDVKIVRLNVWLIDWFTRSKNDPVRFLPRMFSRTRSNTTILSFIEYPISVSNAAMIVRSISRLVRENRPRVMITS